MQDYEKELILKQERVWKLLSGLVPVIEPIIGADDPYHYRNKVHAAFGMERGKIIAGTYEPGTHKIINGGGSDLENEAAVKVVNDIVKTASKYHMSIYNEKTGQGFLRRVLIRTADGTGQMLVVVVVTDHMFPGKKNFVKTLVSKHPEITSIVININRRTDSMILGDKSEVCYGPGNITDTLLGKKFTISAESFYQINRKQAEKLYTKAIEYAALSKSDHVLDAYCGTGTIGICMSDHCRSVIGVELNPKAVSDAGHNIKKNNASNVKVIKADATEYMEDTAAAGKNRFDVVILDPPREGTTPEFIKACGKLNPSRIVYVSCNPETLARDLKLFDGEGYRPKKACPVDMFCFTEHVETCVLLSKLSEAPKLQVNIKMSELDLTASEAKATYEEIQEYVMATTGLHVSNLNIAQTKRKYGIIERQNYNLPKNEDSRQPNCPPEKEIAIVDALKHFKMIQ